MLLESPAGFTPAGGRRSVRTRPTSSSQGGETIEVAGIAFDVLSVPGHSPAHLAYHADGCLFSGDVLFAGSVGRTDLPGADWDTLLASIRIARRRATRPRRSSTRATARSTTLGRRARAQPVPRRAPRGAGGVSARRGSSARAARTTSSRRSSRSGGRVIARDRAPVRALRLPADPTPRLRGHGALRADVRCGLRRRPEGDVHVRGPLRTARSRCVPRATAPICRAYVEHGMHREPQPAKLFTIAPDVPVRGARSGAATASTGRLSVEAIGCDDPSIDAELDPALRHAAPPARRRPSSTLELNSIGCRECRPAYLERLRALARREPRPPRRGDAREGRDEPAARLRQLRGEAARRCAPRSTRRRRSASRSAPRAASTSPPSGAISTRTASSTSSFRRSSAGSTTTRARPGSSSGR